MINVSRRLSERERALMEKWEAEDAAAKENTKK